MSRYNKYLNKAFIDPISIIGALFLVVMLAIGTVVVKNRNISLNINEQAASCMTTCMKEVGDSAECNFVCKVNKPGPVVKAPEPEKKPAEKLPSDKLEKEEIQNLQQVITAPVVIDGTVVNPATSKPVVEKPAAETEAVNPVTVVTPPVVKTCSADGAQYPADSVVVYAGQGSYRKCVDGSWVNNCGEADGTNKPCEITDLTPNFVPTYLGGQYQAAKEAQQQLLNPATEAYVAGPSIQTQNQTSQTSALTEQQIRDKSQCLTEGGSWLANNSCSYSQQTAAVATFKPILQALQYEETTCKRNGGTWSNGKCNEESIGVATNIFATITGGSGGTVTTNSNCPAGSTYISGTCVSNGQTTTAYTGSQGTQTTQTVQNYQAANTSVVTTSVQDLIASLTNRFNSVSQNTGLTNLGTTSLGGGNSPVVTAPLSVLTSNDPNALSDYYRGVGYSMGAGALTAAAIPAASTIYSTGLTTSALMGMNALSAASPAISALTVTGLTVGALDCQFGGGYLCQQAANTLFSGYALSPEGTMQMFQQAGQVYQDTYAILSSIQRIPKTPTMPLLDGSEAPIQLNDITISTNGVIIDGSFVDDGISVANALTTTDEMASLAIIPNQFSLAAPASNNSTNALVANMLSGSLNATNNALSVANLNANAIGGSIPKVFNSISPSSSSFSSNSQSGATGISNAQSPVNLQANGESNIKAPIVFADGQQYYGFDWPEQLDSSKYNSPQVVDLTTNLIRENNLAQIPDLGVSKIDQYAGTAPKNDADFVNGRMGFSETYLATTPLENNKIISAIVKIVDYLGINTAFPDVTAKNWWDRLTGNVTPTEINPLPEIILDPLPNIPAIIDNEVKSPIWAIAPDKGSSVIPAQNLVQNGFSPTIYYATVSPRVINGQLSTDPQVARDLADAITEGLKCGFNTQSILCNTLQIYLDDALALIPDYLKTDLEVLTTFNAIANTFSGSVKRPLLIATKPTTQAVSNMNLGVDTLDVLGRPDLVDKFQKLIWMIKANQGSDVSAAPEAIKNDLYDYEKLVELQDYLLKELKDLGYNKNDVIIPACTELEELCKAGSELAFISPFSLIKPPTEQTFIEKVQKQIPSIITEFLLPPNSNALQTTSSIPETGGGKFKIKIPEWLGGSPAGDPSADGITFQIGKNHQTDFFDNELDKAVSRNHGEITYNPDDGSLTYLDKDNKNGTWFREGESGEFIKLKKNEPLIITPDTEIRPAKGIPFKVVIDNGSISLVDATVFSKKPAILYSNNADDGPVIIEDLDIVTRNTEIINKKELMPETDSVVVDGRRSVEGFTDQYGNINIGTPPAISNSIYYPIYISKKIFEAAEGPNYQLIFDENIPPNLQRILKNTENAINTYTPPEIPQPSKSILEKIKDRLGDIYNNIGVGGSPSVNPDANTDIGSVRIDNGRTVTVLSNQNSNPGAKIEIFKFKPGDLVVEDGDAIPIPQSHINSEPVGYIVNNRTTGEKSLPIRLKANNRLIIPDGNQVDITFGQINQIGLFEEFKTNSPTININSDEINISMSTPLTSSLITKMTGTLEFAITGKTPVLPNYPLPSIGNEIKIIDINDSSLNLNPDIVNAIRWVNKQGIAVLSGPDLGKTNPEIFGGEYPAGGRAFPDKKMIAIKDNILQRGDPDAIVKIYHEAAGHIIGEQLPNNTVPNRIINELLAQRAASLMLIQQGVKADPTSFSNITGLVERYLKLTGKDPYQIIDAVIYKAYPDLQKPLKTNGNSGPKISQQGSFYAPFGFAAALPVGFYYADQYLFDGYLTDKVTDIYNSTIDYLFGTNKQSSTLSKKLIADNPKISGQQGANNPMEYSEDPINVTDKSGDTTPPDGLTKTGEGKCQRIDMSNPCDGDRIYQTYLEYQKQFGDITPAEFLAIILMAEANGADPEFLKSITLATSSQLWGNSDQHEAYCKTTNCEEGIFNFIGAYMEAGTRRYNTLLYEKDPEKIRELIKADQAAIEYFNKNGISILQIANDTIYDPVSTTYSNDTPTQWGNFGCGENCDYLGPNWIKEANQTDIQTGTVNVCGIYDLAGQENSIAAVFTENQRHNWIEKKSRMFFKVIPFL